MPSSKARLGFDFQISVKYKGENYGKEKFNVDNAVDFDDGNKRFRPR